MKALKDHEIIEIDKETLFVDNRGFRYGDGLFETIAVIKGNPRFLDKHLERLQKGAKILQMNVDEQLDLAEIYKGIERLQEENKLFGDAIVRLMIWRKADGRYMPVADTTELLLTIDAATFNKVNSISLAGFSEKTINFPSLTSAFKTMSAAKYVLAGLEKRDKKLDEIILPDHRGYVSEALSSNIFWYKDKRYFTPPLDTGCIDGIMRNWLISKLTAEGYSVKEKLIKPTELVKADCIFTSNATSIGHILNIGNTSFEMDPVVQGMIEKIT